MLIMTLACPQRPHREPRVHHGLCAGRPAAGPGRLHAARRLQRPAAEGGEVTYRSDIRVI